MEGADLIRRLQKNKNSPDQSNQQDLERLRSYFEQIDTAKCGELTKSNMEHLWAAVFPDLNKRAVRNVAEELFAEIDFDDSGTVTFDELANYLCCPTVSGLGGEYLQLATQLALPRNPREWLWAVVEEPASEHYRSVILRRVSLTWSYFTQTVIMVSVINLMVDSLPELQQRSGRSGTDATRAIEFACIMVFTFEFLLRVAACPCTLPKGAKEYGTLITQREFWTTLFTWVDLIAILPFWVQKVILNERGSPISAVRVLRLVRLARIARVLKMGKHSQGIELMLVAVSRATLALVWMAVLLLMAAVFFAALMWSIETDGATFDFDVGAWMRNETKSCPGGPVAFQSIPDSMWWCVVTLTTVGYGDRVPCTDVGKVLASAVMFAGLILLAYPLTILGKVYAEVYTEFEERRRDARRRLALMRELEAGPRRGANGTPAGTTPLLTGAGPTFDMPGNGQPPPQDDAYRRDSTASQSALNPEPQRQAQTDLYGTPPAGGPLCAAARKFTSMATPPTQPQAAPGLPRP